MIAAVSGDEEFPELLIERGASLELKGGCGNVTALVTAAHLGQEAMVKVLLQHDADVHSHGVTRMMTLHYATYNGYKHTVEILVAGGANIETRDALGRTPLHLAAYEGYEAIVRWLVSRGGQIDVCNELGRTVLHEAASRRRGPTVRFLLEAGANVAVEDRNGETTLHIIASTLFLLDDHKAILMLVFKRGGDIGARNLAGKTVLDVVTKNEDAETIVDVLQQVRGEIRSREWTSRQPVGL